MRTIVKDKRRFRFEKNKENTIENCIWALQRLEGIPECFHFRTGYCGDWSYHLTKKLYTNPTHKISGFYNSRLKNKRCGLADRTGWKMWKTGVINSAILPFSDTDISGLFLPKTGLSICQLNSWQTSISNKLLRIFRAIQNFHIISLVTVTM